MRIDMEQGKIPTLEEIRKHKMRMLVVIVNRGQVGEMETIVCQNRARFNYVMLGHGTATSELLDMLGLGSVDKAVLFSLVPKVGVENTLKCLSEQMQFSKAGRGIAFTIPLSGVSGPVLQIVDRDVREELMQSMNKEVEKVGMSATHDLIIAVVNQGCSEELMAVAKTAGATGGTVIHARRTGSEEAEKFFGITIQKEKEVVAILTGREQKKDIMRAIGTDFGLGSDAQGIIFSVPVESTVGLAAPGTDAGV